MVSKLPGSPSMDTSPSDAKLPTLRFFIRVVRFVGIFPHLPGGRPGLSFNGSRSRCNSCSAARIVDFASLSTATHGCTFFVPHRSVIVGPSRARIFLAPCQRSRLEQADSSKTKEAESLRSNSSFNLCQSFFPSGLKYFGGFGNDLVFHVFSYIGPSILFSKIWRVD